MLILIRGDWKRRSRHIGRLLSLPIRVRQISSVAAWANALFGAGQTNEAIAQYQKVVETNPDFAGGYYLLGARLLQSGRGDDAIVQLKKAVELQPQSPTYVTCLGDAFRQKENGQGSNTLLSKGAGDLQPQCFTGAGWI